MFTYMYVYVKLSSSYSDIQTSTQLLIIIGILNISAMKYLHIKKLPTMNIFR